MDELRRSEHSDKARAARTPLQPVIAHLHRHHPLGPADLAVLEALPYRLTGYPANRFLIREGTRADQCAILLEGYACRHKLAANGARQIVSFHIPGDMLDAQQLELECADHNVQTITAATIALIAKRDMRRLVDDRPAIRRALSRSALIEASVFREWVLNVGRRDALTRVAHMLCEFATRIDAAGLGAPTRFELPMTQEHIGDATGLTTVHVNRMLQALDTLGVIQRDRRRVTITDWDRMRRVADFDPAYLHLAA